MDGSTSTRDSKREQIYAAAVREFQDKGFREARMDEISARAGASKRTVYKYFASKEALFQELMQRHWARFERALDITYDPALPIRAQLTALGEAEGGLLTDPEVMATTRLVMTEVLRSPDLVVRNEEKTNKTSGLGAVIAAAVADGQLVAEDPQQVAQEFLSLIKGKAFWPVLYGAPVVSKAEMDGIIANSVEMILSRYGVTG